SGGGFVRVNLPTAIGTGTLTLNSGGSVNIASVSNTAMTNAILFNGGTLGSSGWGTGNGPNITTGDVTFATGTTSTIKSGDPQVLGTAAGSETSFSGPWHGSGNVNLTADQTNPDGGAGIRIKNNTASSDYTGTVTVGQHVKFELAYATAGGTSPLGTGNIILTAGNVSDGSYSEFQVRNGTAAPITLPNNITVTGAATTGPGINIVDLNFPAAGGNVITLGTLRIGSQQLG